MTVPEEKIYLRLREAERAVEAATDKISMLEAELEWYKQLLGIAQKRLYAASSERTTPGQIEMLFNEAEACASPAVPDPATEEITYTRRKSRDTRKKLEESLPTEEINYELAEEEQVCPQCSGALHKMGADIRREIKIIPAQVILVKHLQAKYACRACEHNATTTPILKAKAPETAFPHSLASPSAVAHIITQKFVEGLPLYRQEQSLKRIGVGISRQTMANWVIVGADWLKQIYHRLKARLLTLDVLHADETTVQVLKEPGRKAQQDSYMWLYRSSGGDHPIVLYDYQETRARRNPETFLAGFTGYLHTDGYSAYEKLPGVMLAGCWAHARRGFNDALGMLSPMERTNVNTLARIGLEYCNKLFAIERSLADASAEERYSERLARSKPVMEAMRSWLDIAVTKVLPKCLSGKAIAYCINQWEKLTTVLMDGRLELSNNRAERSIKPFVIGRKNWLFSNTPAGAEASAVIFSIVETAKENNLNPMPYLVHLFETLPNIEWTNPVALEPHLPWAPEIQQRFGASHASTKQTSE